VQKEMPQYGTKTAGEAMMAETADGFLAPKGSDCRFVDLCGHQRWRGF
jgi:hypothetical protein